MIIMSQSGKILCNSEYINKYTISDKPDAFLISAGFGGNELPVTLGRYKNAQEAISAMAELAASLGGGQTLFYMPESIIFAEQEHKRDARTKRKGGS
jgi:hypothetical protein